MITGVLISSLDGGSCHFFALCMARLSRQPSLGLKQEVAIPHKEELANIVNDSHGIAAERRAVVCIHIGGHLDGSFFCGAIKSTL